MNSKGHTYRIMASDLIRSRPIWFGGQDRSTASMAQFYNWLGNNKAKRLRLSDGLTSPTRVHEDPFFSGMACMSLI